jgi:hypothetical protein
MLDWLMFLKFLLICRFPISSFPEAMHLLRKTSHLSFGFSILWICWLHPWACSSDLCDSCKLLFLYTWPDSGLSLCQVHYGSYDGLPLGDTCLPLDFSFWERSTLGWSQPIFTGFVRSYKEWYSKSINIFHFR